MLSFRYRNTAYYLLPSARGEGLLAFDAGWPCSLYEYARAMKGTGFGLDRIRWAMVSHFHLDHAGLVRDFQDAGIECLVFETQGRAIDDMERIIAPKFPNYRSLIKNRLLSLTTEESEGFLASIGVNGRVIPTIGHSFDSVPLVLRSGEACVGNLAPPEQLMPDDAKSHDSWRRIREAGGRRIYPSHAREFEIE